MNNDLEEKCALAVASAAELRRDPHSTWIVSPERKTCLHIARAVLAVVNAQTISEADKLIMNHEKLVHPFR